MDISGTSQTSDSSFIAQINLEQQEQSARERAHELGLGYVNLKSQSINLDALKLLSEEQATELGGLVFDISIKKASVALYNSAKREEIAKTLAGFTCEFYLASRIGIEQAMETYKSDYFHKKKVEVRSKVIEKADDGLEVHLQDFERLESTINTLASESAIAEILLLSVATRASDIHFQPEKEGVTLRLRIDGVLHGVLKIKTEPAKKIVMGIKYTAGMRSNLSDIPQDGSIVKTINGRSIDFRISTLPTSKGIESVVIRILDSSRGIKSFSDLGLASHVEKKILKALYRSNGIVLVTGPTGSGKTTTLYSMLAELNSPERKLVTLEDPIEYHLAGVSQSQVDETNKFTFSSGLKSILRHDPDVILVGEVRTLETARIAFEAALTGHIVMTSLHANSSIGAISRLRNMGVEDFNIAPTISAVFAQKLVRKLCPHCRKKAEYDLDTYNLKNSVQRITKVFPNVVLPLSEKEEGAMATPIAKMKKVDAAFYKVVGCEKCSHTGYLGQTAICEAFLITEDIREMILHKKSEGEIKEYLLDHTDFLTLFEDGLLKVFSGEISLEELTRVAGI